MLRNIKNWIVIVQAVPYLTELLFFYICPLKGGNVEMYSGEMYRVEMYSA